MQDGYGSLYQNVRTDKPHSLRFTLYFCLRRFAFALIIVMLTDSLVLQILAADACILGMLSFYIAGLPMSDGANNFIQIFNEIVVLIICISMMVFTDFVQQPADRYEWGYRLLYMIAGTIAINVSLLIFVILRGIYRTIRTKLIKRKKDKIIKQQQEEKVKRVTELAEMRV